MCGESLDNGGEDHDTLLFVFNEAIDALMSEGIEGHSRSNDL